MGFESSDRTRLLSPLVVVVMLACRASSHSSTGTSGEIDASLAALAAAAVRPAPTFPAPPDVALPPQGATALESGVFARTLKVAVGTDRPKPDDCVKVAFTGWHRDGSLVSTSRMHGDPALHCLRTTMPGMAIALRQMTVGEEDRVWIPGKLTFTSSEPEEDAPEVDLTFDVELLEILRAPTPPTDLTPPKTAVKSRSGLATVVLANGTGAVHPSTGSRVRLRFSGWMADGTLFASTVSAKEPTTFSMSDVIDGWREALSGMVAGEKVRLWVPAKLAFGEKPRRGGQAWGNLIYEIELVEVDAARAP